jgi:hypothetical protein
LDPDQQLKFFYDGGLLAPGVPISETHLANTRNAVVLVMAAQWRTLHFGSARDILRWCLVVPFFTGMLLSSILALKHAPMSLVITFRVLSPLVALGFERLYPNPLKLSLHMFFAIGVMFAGVVLYTLDMKAEHYTGVAWVFLNSFFAVGDRLLQRYMLAADQNPVDISKTGVTLLNNLLGIIPMIPVVFLTGEIHEISGAFASLGGVGAWWVVASCIVAVGIGYCGVWAQSLITATTFLVLVNTNKFVMIFIEVFLMKTKAITSLQIFGCSVAIAGGVYYGKAREMIEDEAKKADSEATKLTKSSKV